eukprot:3183960-Pyramimonas_sp.AAC.1
MATCGCHGGIGPASCLNIVWARPGERAEGGGARAQSLELMLLEMYGCGYPSRKTGRAARGRSSHWAGWNR